MKRNNGFSLVEGVLIVAIVAVIGALGWVFYTNYMTSDDTTSSSTTVKSDDATLVDESMPAVESSDDLQKAETAINAIDIESSVDTSTIDTVLE